MSETLSQLSYGQFLKDQLEFKRSGKRSGEDFNLFDSIGHKYFKILFYFGDQDNSDGLKSNGLLHPTWKITSNDFYAYNSAWSFLKMNDENDRADKLEKFVSLLSNINSYSPWYFKSIGGLDSALERSGPDADKLEVGDRKKITISCIPDAFDNRITTLLDLYRDITWSWSQKRQVLPSNLKKFDMAIYIFESPVKFWHDNETKLDEGDSKYKPSYKMIEFHDCEISYNSAKSGWSEVNNETGFNPTYTIEISYGDCYEVSYNEHIMRSIGDIIATDTYQAVIEDNVNVSNNSFISEAQSDSTIQSNEIERKSNGATEAQTDSAIQSKEIERKSNGATAGFLGNVIGQGVGYVTDFVKEKLTRAVLGNLYTYSLTKIGTQLSELEKGNIIKTGQSVKQYIDNAQERAAARVKRAPSGNIGTGYDTYNKISADGEIFDSTPVIVKGVGKNFGNLANRIAPSSIANN